MATALLFGSGEGPAAQTLRPLSALLGVRLRLVSEEEQGETIGFLCALEGFPRAQGAAAERFTDEMLVLHALSDTQLDSLLRALRDQHISLPLKAVVTEENASWTALHLHEELAREHRAMQRAKHPHPPRRRKKR